MSRQGRRSLRPENADECGVAACRSPRVAVSGICTLRQDGGFAYLSDTCWTPCLMVIGAPDANPLRDMRAPNAKAKRKQR